ncbi:MAG: hypothetical protein Q9166_005829 [cf. Caloplaca sp. 2 TL-2023]
MYLHRTGFRYGDALATHQRRRYRLLPSQNPNPNQQEPDPALWLVHYSQADAAHHLPSSQIPLSPYVQATLTQRKYLQQHGQLVRKEFMLHDRNNWPTINPPGNTVGPQATAYPNNVISHMSRQQPGYVQPTAAAGNQAGIGPPPAKRVRQTISNATEAEVAALQTASDREPSIYDDEDVSRGDLLDFLTPREISAVRYKQHHEWLGEIFRSPYDTQQIVPGDLGLGRKGELEALTKEFFNAPTGPSPRIANENTPSAPARTGRMEPGKADEFTKLANDRISGISGEIEKMKRQHAKRMSRLAKGVEVREAEKALRTASINADDIEIDFVGDDEPFVDGRDSKHATIKTKVEATLGKRVQKVRDVECVEKGRLVEKVNDSDNTSQNFDFPDQVGDLSGQIPNFPTPQDHLSSMEGTPGANTDEARSLNTVPDAKEGQAGRGGADVSMSGVETATPTKEGVVEDWVMVNKESEDAPDAATQGLPDLDTFTNDAAIGSNIGTPGENVGTAAEDLAVFAPEAEGELDTGFNATDFSEGVDFGSLDTAGEALSGYGAEESMGLDDHGDLGLDDTAFGDAFHADSGRDNDLADS